MRHRAAVLFLLAFGLLAQERPSSCSSCPTWNIAQQPFKIYGNSYYVGTHGLGSILITSGAGHVLIDGALPESAPLIAANIRTLGFRLEDVKLILNTHVHFDHAGGIAELQQLTGARVAASRWSAEVMKSGVVPRDDPQFGIIGPIAKVARVETFEDGDILRAGGLTLTAHLTPGHTPGSTSWTWRAVEKSRYLTLVYADSVTAVSARGFKFSSGKDYPNALADFEKSYSFLESTPCDILVTPHPEFANLWERLERRKTNPDALIDPNGCRALSESSRARLKERLAAEKGK